MGSSSYHRAHRDYGDFKWFFSVNPVISVVKRSATPPNTREQIFYD